MLFEFFTVLLMKKFLFKIFFQNKYYERQGEVCSLTGRRPPKTDMASDFSIFTASAWFHWVNEQQLAQLLCPRRPSHGHRGDNFRSRLGGRVAGPL